MEPKLEWLRWTSTYEEYERTLKVVQLADGSVDQELIGEPLVVCAQANLVDLSQ